MTEQTQPTDAEIDTLRDAFDWEGWIDPKNAQSAFARAVLAKWGTPAGVGEPIGYCHEIKWRSRQSEQVQKITRWAQPEYGYTQALYTTPQPTQAQAGAVPLTDEQIDIIRCHTPIPQATDRDEMLLTKADLRVFARAIEQRRGIKGADHG